MPYDYLEELSVSDEGFRVYHETLEGLFRDAWEAVLGLMVEDPGSIRPTKERVIRLKETEPELLLFDFLGELVFLKDAEDSLYRPVDITIAPAAKNGGGLGAGCVLRCRLGGETIDTGRHRTGVDVKAITLQGLSLKQSNDRWEATVVVDT
jgi:SHS2 domain-containing protein